MVLYVLLMLHCFVILDFVLFSGVACACNVRPTVSQSERYQGVISSMKDSFGFIERSDVVREIFFHFSEYEPNDGDLNLQLGDDVEFSIQSRSVRTFLL